MALDYTGANNGLFRHLGKLVKFYNQFQADATDGSTGLDAIRAEILDAFQAGDEGNPDVVVDGLAADFERWKREYVQRRATLSRYALTRLQDRATVLDEIGATSTSQVEILARLFDQMVADSESVEASSVAIGAVSAAAGIAGDGDVLTTDVLDGYSSPGSSNGVAYAAQPGYAGRDTELAVPSETMVLERQVDPFQDPDTVSFTWKGKMPDPAGQHGINGEGSGVIGTVVEAHQGTDIYLSNADFEEFTTTDTPDDWTIDDGTVSTHIKEDSTAANVAYGDKSLQFVGDGAQATIQVSQAIPAGTLNPKRRYAVSAQVKASASIGSGTLVIQFEGTGYTAGGTEKISIGPGSLPTSFELNHFFVAIPASIPTDFKLVVRWESTPTTGKNVWIDDLAIAPVNYGGGVGVVAVRGTAPFGAGDRFSFTVTNTEGVFQRAFRQIFGVQLPSSGSPTIADSLAE